MEHSFNRLSPDAKYHSYASAFIICMQFKPLISFFYFQIFLGKTSTMDSIQIQIIQITTLAASPILMVGGIKTMVITHTTHACKYQTEESTSHGGGY